MKEGDRVGNVRFLGTVTQEVVEQWNIQEHINKPIIIYPDKEEHAKERHLKDFGTLETYECALKSLEEIIRNPDYVFYDKNKSGLEYFKDIGFGVMVAVRVSTGKVLKVKSFYPVSKTKIKNRKRKQENMEMAPFIEKYRYKKEMEIS